MVTQGAAFAAAEASMTRVWEWGAVDCCTAACDAYKALHGLDPMDVLRGRYSSAADAAFIVKTSGGMRSLMTTLGAPLGFAWTDAPKAGDLGLVQTRHGGAMALCLGASLWASKGHGDRMVLLGQGEGFTCRKP